MKLYTDEEITYAVEQQVNSNNINKIICIFGEKYFGKKTLSKKLSTYFQNDKMNEVFVLQTIDCKTIEKINDINENYGGNTSKKIFIISVYQFNECMVNQLVERLLLKDCYNYCFVLLMRPNKEIANYFEKFGEESNLRFSFYGMIPDNCMKNSMDYTMVHTPRINEFPCGEYKDRFLKDDLFAYRCICTNNYYSDMVISSFQNDELLIVALLFGGVIINNAFVGDINILLDSLSESTISCEVLRKKEEFWKLGKGYAIIDGWREFLIYKRYSLKLVNCIKDLYLNLYYNKYFKRRLKHCDISCLQPEQELWLNKGFFALYYRLYYGSTYRFKRVNFNYSNHRYKYCDTNKEYLPYVNRKKIAQIVSEYDGDLLDYLVELSDSLFEETYDFNLILNVLDNLYSNRININMSQYIWYIKKAMRYASQCHEITILEYIIKICVEMWQKGETTIQNIVSIFKEIRGVTKGTLSNLLFEEGNDLMKQIEEKVAETKIFISFCGADSDIAELVYDELKNVLPFAYEILKYDHDVGYMDSITTFMDQIVDCKYVVMIVSDAYLKSEGCMYEVIKTMSQKNYVEKMLPIFIKKEDIKYYDEKKNQKFLCADIYGKIDDCSYATYWTDIKKQQQEHIQALINSNIDNLLVTNKAQEKLKKVTYILMEISNFINLLQDRWQYSFTEMNEENFSPMIERILNGLSE